MAIKRLKRDGLIEVGGEGCPHGNIVGMDSPVSRRERGLRPLEEAQAGEAVTVASVFERDRTLLEYLDGVGIRPGARLEVHPELEIQVDGRTVRVERAVAAKVWVQNTAVR